MKWEAAWMFDGVWFVGDNSLVGVVSEVNGGWRWQVIRDGLPVVDGLCSTCELAKQAAESVLLVTTNPELTLAQFGAEVLPAVHHELVRAIGELVQWAKRELPRALREAGMLP